jgi:hypothetical protein
VITITVFTGTSSVGSVGGDDCEVVVDPAMMCTTEVAGAMFRAVETVVTDDVAMGDAVGVRPPPMGVSNHRTATPRAHPIAPVVTMSPLPMATGGSVAAHVVCPNSLG